jgi:CheY-like chemotaxis protein
MDPLNLDRPKEILLVEDSSSDAKLVMMALNKSSRRKRVISSMNGDEAMEYLKKSKNGTKPHLILLDLNLPKKNGLQVLAECKADASLKCIPVVVFTTSDFGNEAKRCYDLGANSFISKPFDLEAFQRAIELIEDYWLGLSASAV